MSSWVRPAFCRPCRRRKWSTTPSSAATRLALHVGDRCDRLVADDGVVAGRVVVDHDDRLLRATGDRRHRVVERLRVGVELARRHRVERRDVVGEVLQVDVEPVLLEDACLRRPPRAGTSPATRCTRSSPCRAWPRARSASPRRRCSRRRRRWPRRPPRRRIRLCACPREPPGWADQRARYGCAVSVEGPSKHHPVSRCLTGCLPTAGARSAVWRQATTAAASSASALRRTRSRSRGATSSPRTVRSARNAPTAWCSAADALHRRAVAPGDPQPVLRAFVVRHHRERGEPGIDRRAAPSALDALGHDRGELLDEVLALGPVAGERLRVAGGEAVDLVEVVGQRAQGRHVGSDDPVELHRGRSARGAHPRHELERCAVRLADDLVEQLALAAEVVVERRLLQAAAARDLGHRGARRRRVR